MVDVRRCRALAVSACLLPALLACGGGGGGGSGSGDSGTSVSVEITGFDAISGAEQFSVPLSVQASQDGAQLSWEVRDAGGNSVRGQQQVGIDPMPMYGVDLSALDDGPLTLLAEVIDVRGNTAPLPAITAEKDTQGPAAALLAFPGSVIDVSNQGSFSFDIILADPGVLDGDWIVTVTDAMGVELHFSGNADSATVEVGPLDLSVLNAGPVTFLVRIKVGDVRWFDAW